jgi:hypothetical protein
VAVAVPSVPAAPVVEHVSLGSKQCQSCHQAIFEHEKESRHWLSFKEFSQGAGADVAAKMNVPKPTEVGTRCVECHGHTYLNDRGKLKTEPISCEACHGKAGDYLAAHNSTYDPAKHGGDQNAFLAKRRAASVAAGMTAQWRLNGGYRNCFTCHVGTDEPIVNTAGHPVMTNFELLAFSQGSVRHWHGTDMTADKPGRLGAIHLAGQAMMLEKSLQAVGTSQAAGAFRTQYFQMAKAAQARLVALSSLAPSIAELKAITAATAAVASMTDGNPAECAALAKTIAPLVNALNDQLDDKPLADDLGAKLIPADMPKP